MLGWPIALDPFARSQILGTGSYAPPLVVTNDDLAKSLDTSDAWIAERTGIRRRHVAAPGEAASDMAAAASHAALQAAGVGPTDLDMIVVGTFTGDRRLPSCAVHLQALLGAEEIPAFDVAAACAGFVYALAIADQFIVNGTFRRILVVGVEALSSVTDWTDRNTAVLFGDGAGAVVLGSGPVDGPGVLSTCLQTDGALADLLRIPAGGSAEPISIEALAAGRDKIQMAGGDVFRVAVRNLTTASTQAVKAAGLTMPDVDWVVPHQANLRILTQVAGRLGVPMERLVVDIDEYGNTSSGSIPIALDEAVRDGRITKDQTVLLCAIGAGMSWGAAVLRL